MPDDSFDERGLESISCAGWLPAPGQDPLRVKAWPTAKIATMPIPVRRSSSALPSRLDRRMKQIIRDVVPNSIIVRVKYRTERALFEGRDIAVPTTNSVVFFTVHKCASTFVPKALAYLSKKHAGLFWANLPAFLSFKEDKGGYGVLHENREKIFRDQGFLYAPLRRYVEIPNIDRYNVLLMLRDPRDVLVSRYFSMAFTHYLPSTKGLRVQYERRRRRVRTMSIDEFVVQVMPWVKTTYLGYLDKLVDSGHAKPLRYEDMVQRFPEWIREVASRLQIEITDGDAAHLERLGGFDKKRTEDPYSHIRQMTPGDYQNKLTSETIDVIDRELHDVLVRLGYADRP